MNRREFLPAVGAALVLPRTVAYARQPSFAELLKASGVPSFAMATVNRDGVSCRAEGVLRQGETTPATCDAVYAAASLTKPVFAYTFLSLVRDGLIALDRPVTEYLPLPNATDERASRITSRHLLSHSSGWRNWRNTNTDTLTCAFEPGSAWSYSGEGFFFLQRILEQVTGKSMAVVCRERVFGPLGMTRSSMAALATLEPYQATGHNQDGAPRAPFGRATLVRLREDMATRGLSLEDARVQDAEAAHRSTAGSLPTLPNFLSPNAAASMLTTASDYGKFIQHLIRTSSAGGSAADVVAQMFTPQVRRNDAIQWGLGVGIEQVRDHPVGWQWGDNPGFKNFFAVDLNEGTGVAIFTNGDRGSRVYERVIRGATGIDHPGFLFV